MDPRSRGRLEQPAPPPVRWTSLSPQLRDRLDELLRDRLFNGTEPPWPEAVEATGQGQAVAAHLGVPFHFASPVTPDDCLPRWWDTQPDG